MQNIQITAMESQHRAAWDEYVDSHAEGSFFHLTGWQQVIARVFKHKSHYLLAFDEDAQQIVGVLPLFEQKSRLFGHALVSTPFCVYGGVVADSDEIRQALEQKAFELGCLLNVDYVELRDRVARDELGPWVNHCHHSVFATEIAENDDEILTRIKRKQRAVVRHALNNQLEPDNKDNIDECYDLYAQSVHSLGTPVFNQRLFAELKAEFAERCETLIVRDNEGRPVSSVMSFYYKDTVLPYYGGGTDAARDLKSHDFMYYQLMCMAKQKGCTRFDFGRSKTGSGAYKYKKHWGMQETPLHYRIALVKAKQLPNLSPNNPKYKLFIELWKKIPLRLSRQLGPELSKYLG